MRTQSGLKFVTKYMKLMGVYTEAAYVPSGCSLEEFVTEYLRNDGIFVLRILSHNVNEVMVAELVEDCWKRCVLSYTLFFFLRTSKIELRLRCF